MFGHPPGSQQSATVKSQGRWRDERLGGSTPKPEDLAVPVNLQNFLNPAAKPGNAGSCAIRTCLQTNQSTSQLGDF